MAVLLTSATVVTTQTFAIKQILASPAVKHVFNSCWIVLTQYFLSERSLHNSSFSSCFFVSTNSQLYQLFDSHDFRDQLLESNGKSTGACSMLGHLAF